VAHTSVIMMTVASRQQLVWLAQHNALLNGMVSWGTALLRVQALVKRQSCLVSMITLIATWQGILWMMGLVSRDRAGFHHCEDSEASLYRVT